MTETIMTVLGPISPAKLGITDAHNHLWLESLSVPAVDPPVLDQQAKIEQELLAFRQAGGDTQLDCQPGGAGRNGVKLRQLSEKTGVQVIACTGFHLREYYPVDSRLWNMDLDQAWAYFRGEIEEGLQETRSGERVYPGFIKIAVRETLPQSPQKLMEAAARTSLESGLCIEMHTQKGARAEDFVNFFSELGVTADRLVICHIDKRPDLGLHQELAAEGCLLEYDTFFRLKYQPEKNLWPLIEKMVKAGCGKSIAVATDLADSSMWASMGKGPGLPGLINVIKTRLEEIIPDQEIILGLMGGNIARHLAG